MPAKSRFEARAVRQLAVVEPEHRFVEVGVEVEGARRDVGTVQRPLHAGPEVLDIVRVNATLGETQRVVDEVVNVVAIGLPVRAERIRVEDGAGQHVRLNARDERRRLSQRQLFWRVGDNCLGGLRADAGRPGSEAAVLLESPRRTAQCPARRSVTTRCSNTKSNVKPGRKARPPRLSGLANEARSASRQGKACRRSSHNVCGVRE